MKLNNVQREKYNLINKFCKINLQGMNTHKYRSDGLLCNITRTIINQELLRNKFVFWDEVKTKFKGIVIDKLLIKPDGTVYALEIETNQKVDNIKRKLEPYKNMSWINCAFIVPPVNPNLLISDCVVEIKEDLRNNVL